MHKNKQFSFLFSFFLLNQIEAIRFCWLLMKRNKLWRNESIHALIADDTNNAQFKQSLNGKNTAISTKQYECRGTNCTFYVHRASFGVHRHTIFVSPQIRCNIPNHVFFVGIIFFCALYLIGVKRVHIFECAKDCSLSFQFNFIHWLVFRTACNKSKILVAQWLHGALLPNARSDLLTIQIFRIVHLCDQFMRTYECREEKKFSYTYSCMNSNGILGKVN